MDNEKIACFGVIFYVCSALINGSAFAGDGTGIINKYHLNGTASGRGACIQLSPALTGTPDGWACLWQSNLLYKEINATLLAAYIAHNICKIDWNSFDSNGMAVIGCGMLLNS